MAYFFSPLSYSAASQSWASVSTGMWKGFKLSGVDRAVLRVCYAIYIYIFEGHSKSFQTSFQKTKIFFYCKT